MTASSESPHDSNPQMPPPTGENSVDSAAGDNSVAELREALAAAEAKSAESRDLYMRALAEMDNLRKRAARDVEQAHKYALEKFSQELINVKDSLELGLQAGQSTNAEGLLAGTEATLQLLTKAFDKVGIVTIEPLNQSFDPQLHEAMVTQPSTEHPPNTVLQVVQKGYQLNGRLLRPARVIVSR